MRTLATAVLGAAVVSALLFAPLAGTAAAAETAPAGAGEMSATYTRGFTITNLGSHTLRLLSVSGNTHAEDGVPLLGTTVEPGFSTRFEVTWLYAQKHAIEARFAVLDAQGAQIGTYDATMEVHQPIDQLFNPSLASAATITPGIGQARADRDQLTVLDMPGTVIDVPAGQG